MPENDETPETTEGEAAEPDQAATEPEPTGANAEAAKYRSRLRAVEAERDQLAEKVDALHRAEIRRAAADAKMIDPDDLRVEPADVLNDDGDLDTEKVGEHIAELRTSKRHLFQPPPDFGGGVRGDNIPAGPAPMDWKSALDPQVHRAS